MIPNLLDGPVATSPPDGSTDQDATTALPGDAASLFASLLAGIKAPLVADGKEAGPGDVAGPVVLPGQRPAVLLEGVLEGAESPGPVAGAQAGPWFLGEGGGAAAGQVATPLPTPGAPASGEEAAAGPAAQPQPNLPTLALGLVAEAVTKDPQLSASPAPDASGKATLSAMTAAVLHRGQVNPATVGGGLAGAPGLEDAVATPSSELTPAVAPASGAIRSVGLARPVPVATPAPDAIRSDLPAPSTATSVPAMAQASPPAPTTYQAPAMLAGQAGVSGHEARTAGRTPSSGQPHSANASAVIAATATEEPAIAAESATKPAASEALAMTNAEPSSVASGGSVAEAAPTHHSVPEAASAAAMGHLHAVGTVDAVAGRPVTSVMELAGNSTTEASAGDAAGSRRIQAQVTRAILSGSGLNTGDQNLTLQLEPDHLGKVEVRLMARGNRLEVTFTAETPEAQQALREGSSDLVRALAGRVDGRWQQVDIKVADPGDPRRDNAQQDPRDQDRPRDGRRESDQQERRRERRQNQ